MNEELKTCFMCGEDKPLCEYYKFKHRDNRPMKRCRTCMSKRNKEYYLQRKAAKQGEKE